MVGGYRCRGTAHPRLAGVYLYGDFCTGKIWGAVPEANGTWKAREPLDTPLSISTFGENEAGELFDAHHAAGGEGAIYQIHSMP